MERSVSIRHDNTVDLSHVLSFIERDGLKEIVGAHAKGLGCLVESVDVLHLLEGHAGGVNLGDTAFLKLVGETEARISAVVQW